MDRLLGEFEGVEPPWMLMEFDFYVFLVYVLYLLLRLLSIDYLLRSVSFMICYLMLALPTFTLFYVVVCYVLFTLTTVTFFYYYVLLFLFFTI